MNLKILSFSVLFIFSLNACARTETPVVNQSENKTSARQIDGNGNFRANDSSENAAEDVNSNRAENAVSQTSQPKTARDFFNLLPEKYFILEGCDKAKDKNCNKARAEYLKTYLETDDVKNGYLKAGCDGAQSCLTMALFKRPDATYIVHILTEHEGGEESYFLDFKNGKWTDIGASVVPEYSQKNTYVPPRVGTTVEVFKKNFPEPEFSERGEKLYDLTWKNGKFERQK